MRVTRYCLSLTAAVLLFIASVTFGQSKEVEAVVERFRIDSDFNGVVLIARNGKVEYQKYVGLANRQDSVWYSPKSRFHIFSVTKTFTAALVMLLYERGKIHLDSTIGAYYPDYRGEGADKVKIKDLLTYSSGRDKKEMREIAEAYNSTAWPVDSFITRYCSERLITRPGTSFDYNNGDFILLGKIIELIYGQSFQQALRQHILVPLNMQDTDFLHHDDVIAHLDQGYFNSDQHPFTFYKPTNYYIDNYFSAGAMYSTPEDLLRFDQAIFKHQLLKKGTVDFMLSSYPNLGDVGIGFWVYPKQINTEQYQVAERQGYGYGHHANWVHLIDQNITLLILSNTNTVDPNQMRWEVLSAFLRNTGKNR
ncbi:serine hydrolase [Dyadobacter luteus]|uniref:Serine hydrolase n=1 Tax=Dyadobacter luteus TaxID=2259619 RepID=A0A3D8YGJ5_9BACT|nr:serine hydrolase domain-containing protein [Dyadobacter luteus]REA63802.1 serine hydrolase [Dyadobacter luteus]